jgi:hypothetical protein
MMDYEAIVGDGQEIEEIKKMQRLAGIIK